MKKEKFIELITNAGFIPCEYENYINYTYQNVSCIVTKKEERMVNFVFTDKRDEIILSSDIKHIKDWTNEELENILSIIVNFFNVFN